MQQMVKYLRTNQFVRIKQNFGIHKIRKRQITLYIELEIMNITKEAYCWMVLFSPGREMALHFVFVV